MGLGTEGGDLPGRIGGYTLERELGAGGMGTVYLARSRGGRTVAVKVARPELAADPHFRARFRAEVEAARKVGGFHTAPVVDADPDAATPWLATAYIPGPTLSRMLGERGPMDEERLRLLGAALAEALQAIHACGLIHRDLKPGNIIMADDGPRVLDFGIARALESTRLTSTGTAFGTPGFLAPEQAQGLEVGPAADVFALGAVLVAAAGGSAFGEGTPMALMYRSVHEQPDLSALPGEIRPMVADCLSKDPAQRPTPERLLDLLSPEPPSDAPHSDAPPSYTPTVSAPALPTPARSAPPTPTATPTAGAIESAATVTATPTAEPRTQEPTAAPQSVRRPGVVVASVLAVALLLIGGAVYATYALKEPEKPFPEATHELTLPTSIMGGTYVQDAGRSDSPSAMEDDAVTKDATRVSITYTGTSKSRFGTLQVSGWYGRLKDPERQRDAHMNAVTEALDARSLVPRQEFRLPGSDVEFSCEMVNYLTVCAWADDNTVGSVSFEPATASLDVAAAETRKIRDDMRKPIVR
ncbi:serine/threonine-protein kinase [Streptomyces sp. NPDC012769]|uniref:serine/threonine-protein kinase n=1 Tax=Streptomyces sp. NPDC012769 TaxID=3364848 RepID=UPI0036AE2490